MAPPPSPEYQASIFLHRFHNLDLPKYGWYTIRIVCFWSGCKKKGAPARAQQYTLHKPRPGEPTVSWRIGEDDASYFSRPYAIRHARQDVQLHEMLSFHLPFPKQGDALVINFDLLFSSFNDGPPLSDAVDGHPSTAPVASQSVVIPPTAVHCSHSFASITFDALYFGQLDIAAHATVLGSQRLARTRATGLCDSPGAHKGDVSADSASPVTCLVLAENDKAETSARHVEEADAGRKPAAVQGAGQGGLTADTSSEPTPGQGVVQGGEETGGDAAATNEDVRQRTTLEQAVGCLGRVVGAMEALRHDRESTGSTPENTGNFANKLIEPNAVGDAMGTSGSGAPRPYEELSQRQRMQWNTFNALHRTEWEGVLGLLRREWKACLPLQTIGSVRCKRMPPTSDALLGLGNYRQAQEGPEEPVASAVDPMRESVLDLADKYPPVPLVDVRHTPLVQPQQQPPLLRRETLGSPWSLLPPGPTADSRGAAAARASVGNERPGETHGARSQECSPERSGLRPASSAGTPLLSLCPCLVESLRKLEPQEGEEWQHLVGGTSSATGSLAVDLPVPKGDLAQGAGILEKHVVVLVHGYGGSSNDLHLWRNYWRLLDSNIDTLTSDCNEAPTSGDGIEALGRRLAEETAAALRVMFGTVDRPHPRHKLVRLSFVGFSLGALIVRAALLDASLKPYLPYLHLYVSIAGPHLGYLYGATSSLLTGGLWALKRLQNSAVLHQLGFSDAKDRDMPSSFLFRLSQDTTWHKFRHVVLVASPQDKYVPYHSARFEIPKAALLDPVRGGSYAAMADGALRQLLEVPALNGHLPAGQGLPQGMVSFERCDVEFPVGHSLGQDRFQAINSILGRGAHLAFLECDEFVRFFFWSHWQALSNLSLSGE